MALSDLDYSALVTAELRQTLATPFGESATPNLQPACSSQALPGSRSSIDPSESPASEREVPIAQAEEQKTLINTEPTIEPRVLSGRNPSAHRMTLRTRPQNTLSNEAKTVVKRAIPNGVKLAKTVTNATKAGVINRNDKSAKAIPVFAPTPVASSSAPESSDPVNPAGIGHRWSANKREAESICQMPSLSGAGRCGGVLDTYDENQIKSHIREHVANLTGAPTDRVSCAQCEYIGRTHTTQKRTLARHIITNHFLAETWLCICGKVLTKGDHWQFERHTRSQAHRAFQKQVTKNEGADGDGDDESEDDEVDGTGDNSEERAGHRSKRRRL